MRVFKVFCVFLVFLYLSPIVESAEISSGLSVSLIASPEQQKWSEFQRMCSENGCSCEKSSVTCSEVVPHMIEREILDQHPNLRSLTFTDCVEVRLFAKLQFF